MNQQPTADWHADMAGTVADLMEEKGRVMRELEIEAACGVWHRSPPPRPVDTETDRARRRAEHARDWRGGDP